VSDLHGVLLGALGGLEGIIGASIGAIAGGRGGGAFLRGIVVMALGGGVAIRGGATMEVGCWAEFCNMGRVIGAQRRKDQVGKDNLAVGAQMQKWLSGKRLRRITV
jgi:hypothetical protein